MVSALSFTARLESHGRQVPDPVRQGSFTEAV